MPTRRAEFGICRCRPHGKTDAGISEKPEQQDQHDQRDDDHAGLMSADQTLAEQCRIAKRTGERLDREVPDETCKTVEDRKQRDKHNDVAQQRRILDRLEHRTLHSIAAQEGDRDRQPECRPIGDSPLQQLPGDEGGKHRHLALRKIELVDRLVDHDDRQRHAGVDAARCNSRQHLLSKYFHPSSVLSSRDRRREPNHCRGIHCLRQRRRWNRFRADRRRRPAPAPGRRFVRPAAC